MAALTATDVETPAALQEQYTYDKGRYHMYIGWERLARMTGPKIAVWRRRIGTVCAIMGIVLFAAALLPYLRYAANLNDQHVQERLQHAHTLSLLWRASLYGSVVLSIVSLFGLGWGRWIGLTASIGALFYALATLGAMCGPFGC